MSNFEQRYKSELPYLQQSASWKSGMKYRYSPDSYPISKDLYQQLCCSGELMGKFMEKKFGNNVLAEFRMDFMVNQQGKAWITEVQTDDRGIPAMVLARNTKGVVQPSLMPGVVSQLNQSLVDLSPSKPLTLLITYPGKEEFYYSGFRDLAILCWENNPDVRIIVSPIEKVDLKKDSVNIMSDSISESGLIQPTLYWDFSGQIPGDQKLIQPFVDKNVLLQIWSDTDPINVALREYVPFAGIPALTPDLEDQQKWIIKPLSLRWSKGIVIGGQTNKTIWQEKLQDKDILVQTYIQPRTETFWVRDEKGKFRQEQLLARVEGYYCGNKDGWKLADVLATCTKKQPIHGMRECIMIPGEVIT